MLQLIVLGIFGLVAFTGWGIVSTVNQRPHPSLGDWMVMIFGIVLLVAGALGAGNVILTELPSGSSIWEP